MKQILGIVALFALTITLFVGNAQEEPKKVADKEKTCVTKTADKKASCASKAKTMKASNKSGCSTDGKAKLMKASNKTDGCAVKTKADCASKCPSKASKAKHASAETADDAKN